MKGQCKGGRKETNDTTVIDMRIRLYPTNQHPVYGGVSVMHEQPYIKVDPRQAMKVKQTKDLHKLISECDAERLSNSISVRNLFEKKLSRKERKRKHRNF